MRRGTKFGAIRTVVEGISFASKREANRYAHLRLLQRAGEIEALVLQPAFPLKVVNLDTGELTQIGTYRADFWYLDTRTQQPIVEDAKGWRTREYKRTKKHVEAQYGIRIVEV